VGEISRDKVSLDKNSPRAPLGISQGTLATELMVLYVTIKRCLIFTCLKHIEDQRDYKADPDACVTVMNDA